MAEIEKGEADVKLIGILAILAVASFCVACADGKSEVAEPVARDETCAGLGEYLTQVTEVTERWEDLHRLAAATSRIALAPMIAQMQDLHRSFVNMDRPSCAGLLSEQIAKAMDREITAFVAFLEQEPDSMVERLLDEAAAYWSDALEARSDLSRYR